MNKKTQPTINLTFVRGGSSYVGKPGTMGEHWYTCSKISLENKFYLPTYGVGELFIAGTHYRLEKYKWFLIGEGESRSYYTIPGNELEKRVVHFYSDTGTKPLKEALDLPDCIELNEQEYQKAVSLMNRINHPGAQVPAELYEVFSNKSKIYNILSYYIELSQKKNLHKSCHDDENSHIRQMMLEYIQKLGAKDVSSKKLAQAMSMNESYFFKYFKKLFSLTPHQLIFKMRMSKTLWRLVDSPYSINEIARSSGFESLSHFTKMFKAQTGMTPLVFRNKYLNAPVSSDFEIADKNSNKH